MNNVNWLGQGSRWLILLLLQVLIFKSVELSGIFNGVQLLVYPMVILLLPMRTPTVLLLVIAFITGLLVDTFYNSLGIHAAACVFMAYLRPLVISLLQPREGYNLNHNPTKRDMGFQWFLTYSTLLMTAFVFFYFSVEAFSFVHIGRILQRSILSLLLIMPVILAYQVLFNPR